MDFIDVLKQFSLRIYKLKENIGTEEATKMSMIVPFFQILGYDVFNPDEFMPEYTADVGIKKGEKVDYAIIKDGIPIILIEAKWCGAPLDKHDSQLFRYFGTSPAKFGILTNGIIYKFYTDLEESNKMDLDPFLEINMLEIKENHVHELRKFQKNKFDAENIFSTASELKYSKAIKDLIRDQMSQPSDDFVKYILLNIYDRHRTQAIIDKFKPIVKKSLNEFMNEMMNEKITSALNITKTDTEEKNIVENIQPEEEFSRIYTTNEEIEAFYIIKSLLNPTFQKDRLYYKDNESYFSIIIDNNIRKWVCRLLLNETKKRLIVRDENKKEIKYDLSSINDIYTYADLINNAVENMIV